MKKFTKVTRKCQALLLVMPLLLLLAIMSRAETAKATFQILPAKVSLKTPTTKKGQMTVTWTANAKQGASYKIQYSTTKTFESTKSVTVTSPKTGSKTIKDLKSGKTYYVRIRAYKQVAGKTYTGSWSTVRYVKIK